MRYQEPGTYAQLLRCTEHRDWKHARKLKRKALWEREVIEVMPTPAGVEPMGSRFVYKRKYTKVGR